MCQAELSEHSLSHQGYYQGLFHCFWLDNTIVSSNGEDLIVNIFGFDYDYAVVCNEVAVFHFFH